MKNGDSNTEKGILGHNNWAGINGIIGAVGVVIALLVNWDLVRAQIFPYPASSEWQAREGENAPNDSDVETALAEEEAKELTRPAHDMNSDQFEVATATSEPRERKFTVFFDNLFELCGYQEVSLTQAASNIDSSSITILVGDRSFPKWTVQGYRRSIATDQVIKLWHECEAEFTIERSAGKDSVTITTRGE